MLSADATVNQIQQDQIPDYWHIVQGRGSPSKSALQTLAFGLLGGLIGTCLGYAIQGKFSIPLDLPNIVWTIGPMIVWPFLAWRRAREARNSFLIMEPEGFMLLTHYNSPTKRTLRTYFYRDITSIDLQLRLLTHSTLDMNIYYHDGIRSWVLWVNLDTRFGRPPIKIAQMIIVAHAQYMALHPYAA